MATLANIKAENNEQCIVHKLSALNNIHISYLHWMHINVSLLQTQCLFSLIRCQVHKISSQCRWWWWWWYACKKLMPWIPQTFTEFLADQITSTNNAIYMHIKYLSEWGLVY